MTAVRDVYVLQKLKKLFFMKRGWIGDEVRGNLCVLYMHILLKVCTYISLLTTGSPFHHAQSINIFEENIRTSCLYYAHSKERKNWDEEKIELNLSLSEIWMNGFYIFCTLFFFVFSILQIIYIVVYKNYIGICLCTQMIANKTLCSNFTTLVNSNFSRGHLLIK